MSFNKRKISFGSAPPSSVSFFGSLFGVGIEGLELGMPFIISLPGARCPGGKPGCLWGLGFIREIREIEGVQGIIRVLIFK